MTKDVTKYMCGICYIAVGKDSLRADKVGTKLVNYQGEIK